MKLYEYLIGGKKTGQIDDLKDPIPGGKPFCELKIGESLFISKFKRDGTCVYAYETKITSIDKKYTHWLFIGFTKKGEKYACFLYLKDLDKTLFVENQLTYYNVFSTFEMDDESLFELVKKEI